MMNEEQSKSTEEKTLATLKEVNQNIKDNPERETPDQGEASAEKVVQDMKGSDADIDQGSGFDEKPDLEQIIKQQKGAD